MVELGFQEQRGGFDGVWEVAAEFPGLDAGEGVAEGGGGVWGVELGADLEEVCGMAPGGCGVS